MPRDKRLELPGAVYHVIVRGLERREIYKDATDRKEFLRRLEKGLRETGDQCYGWVLMPNHFHLLIRSGTKPLNELMRGLLTGYALYFNRRHRRSGYLYQGRYKSILCQEDAYLLELVRYIHLNPMRGRLVKDLIELNKYPWSGHSVIMGHHKLPWQETGELLSMFGQKKCEAVARYLEFVKDGLAMGKRDDLTGGGLIRSAGGWEGVLLLKKAKERWQGDERILGDGDFVSQILKISEEELERKEKLRREGWTLDKLAERVCELMSIKKDELLRRSRLNNISRGRALFSYWASKELGVSGQEIAKYMGISNGPVSKGIRQGEKIAKNYKLKDIMQLRP
ncbi:MAG: transposase [bacterium]|nr:transposase [bacterium]